MIKDYFLFSISNLTHRGLRSWLTMLGIFIGIAAVVALISLGQGLQNAISEEFQKIGTDKIIVAPGSSFLSGPPGSFNLLSTRDAEIVKKVKGVEEVSVMMFMVSQVEFSNEVKYTFVSGIPQDKTKKIIMEMESINIKEGRDLQSSDKYKVVIGQMVADGEFFDKKVKLRDTILIDGQEFRVVGILDKVGNPSDDSALYIPLETAREFFNQPTRVDQMLVKVSPAYKPSDVAEAIKKELRQDRNQDEGEEDFNVQTTEQLIESFQNIFSIVQWVLIGIAAISLLVGGVGITNTMYTAVLERTKEIGIMKAVGAKNSDIMLIFLIESGLLGLIGGLIGIGLGIGLAKAVEIIATQRLGITLLQADISLTLILGSLLFSYLVGSISGLLPAIRASKKHPVEALRGGK